MNEAITPDPNWRESIDGIINMGRFIKTLKASMTHKDLVRVMLADYGIQASGMNRIAKISEDEILTDPAHRDRLPPSWGLLHELRLLPREILLDKLAKNEVKGLTKYQVWKIRGIKTNGRSLPSTATKNGRFAGAKVYIADGISLIGHVRTGMEFEAREKANAEEVANYLDIYPQTYRMIRTLVQLSERPELTEHDREFVNGLLEKIEKTRNIRSFYREAKPLIERIWGDNISSIKNDKGMQKRVDAFRTMVIILHDTCQRIMDQEVPYMSDEDVNSSINELVNSGKIIRKLAEKLRRSKDG